MRLSSIEVDHEDLIKTSKTSDLASSAENEPLVSTAIFPKLLREMEMHSRPGAVDEETIQTVYNESLICLRRIMIFLRDINLSRDMKSPLRADLEPKSATPSLRDRVILSVYALGDFLHYALMLWLPSTVTPAEPEWGKLRYIPFLKERLINAGWCRSEANLLDDQPTGLSSLYYMSFIDRNCSAETMENVLMTSLVITRISRAMRLCIAMIVQEQQIISEGSIPVVTVEVDRVHPESEKPETPMPGRMILPDAPKGLQGRLTSIPLSSTVLSDQPNTVQYVAFSHVWQDGLGNQDANALLSCQLLRLQKLANDLYKPYESTPFWLDTLCVPLEEGFRKRAIGNMFNVYRQAEHVLVLDSTILLNKVKTTDPFQLLISIRTSNWVRRLWTFQEGAIARSLQFQFAETALDLGDIITAVVETSKDQDDELKDLGFEYERDEGSDERLIAADNLLWPAWNYLQEIQDIDFTTGTARKRLENISMPLCWRNTTRASDEPICLSSLLGLDQEVRRAIANASSDRRMQILLQNIGELPSQILFVNRPHFTDDGYRWLPRSFLGGGRQATMFASSRSTDSSAIAKVLKSGLLVPRPGFLLEGSVNYKDMFFAMGDSFSTVIMAAPDASFDLDDFSKKKLAVVLKEDLSSDFAKMMAEDRAPGCMGVLVSMRELTSGNKSLVVQYEQLVKVFLAQSQPFGQDQGNMRLVTVAHDQEWIVQ